MTTTPKITQLFLDGGFTFSGYLTPKTSAFDAAELAAKELWILRGQIAGLKRAGTGSASECPAQYRDSWLIGYRAGVGQTLTKAGVKAALIAMGHESFPSALKETVPSKDYIIEEKEFAEYLVADTDFGGAWNDDAQINLHLN